MPIVMGVKIKVDVFSDILCPWCYIGKRRLEAALASFPHKDDVEVTWRSFQLDPSAPRSYPGTVSDMLAKKYGMSKAQAEQKHAEMTALAAKDGLDYHFEKTKPGNSFDAHRLIKFAASKGKNVEMKERLMKGYFTDGADIGDHGALAKMAEDVGLDRAEAETVLASDAYGDEVKTDLREASQGGISGVPAFIFNDKYLVSGAQPAELLGKVLEKVWEESAPDAASEGAACEVGNPGAC
ncbi:MAG TPA: DsbA family oxidoreductase [Polyangiaceae bacterium]